MTIDFERARTPDQKAERRADILTAAHALLDEVDDVHGLSLNELGRRAGMSKSNVYRYFESREAVLLAILEDDMVAWVTDAVATIPSPPATTPVAERIDRLSTWLADATASHVRLCRLLAVLASVLEHNVSAERVARFKRHTLTTQAPLAEAMAHLVPELGLDGHLELLRHGFVYIVGSWPLAHPSASVDEALQAPDLAPFRHVFAADLARATRLWARGLLSDDGTP